MWLFVFTSLVLYRNNFSAYIIFDGIFSFLFFAGGKSAVLTAIMIGLGGKASVTNRGSTLKNFIKTGRR